VNQERFLQLWSRRGGGEGERVLERLTAHYSEEHRAYHNARHIVDCLREFDKMPLRPMPVEMAIWFHDVIYDPRRKDNEEQSAAHFLNECRVEGMTGEWMADVSRLIHVTAHHRPMAEDEAIPCDIDVSILGRTPAEYARYVAAVRFEYAWVLDEDWRTGRAAVLRSFLERPVIYHTGEYAPLEYVARANLENEWRSLQL
jgi:predicted metal-dependent HD superfamily phosphohydrolase